MPKVILSRTMRYQGAILQKGTPLDVTDAQANEFTTKGYATREVKAKPAEVKAAVAPPVPPKPAAPVGATTLDQGMYATRDLKAKP